MSASRAEWALVAGLHGCPRPGRLKATFRPAVEFLPRRHDSLSYEVVTSSHCCRPAGKMPPAAWRRGSGAPASLSRRSGPAGPPVLCVFPCTHTSEDSVFTASTRGSPPRTSLRWGLPVLQTARGEDGHRRPAPHTCRDRAGSRPHSAKASSHTIGRPACKPSLKIHSNHVK